MRLGGISPEGQGGQGWLQSPKRTSHDLRQRKETQMQFRVKMVGELEVEMETLMFFSWSSRNWGHMQNMVKHFIVCLRGKFGVLWIDSQEAYRYKVFRPHWKSWTTKVIGTISSISSAAWLAAYRAQTFPCPLVWE